MSSPESNLSATIAAWVATFFSFISAGIAWRMYQVTLGKLEAQKPKINLYLADGYSRTIADGKVYAFSLTVSNQSDNDNSISRLELDISYRRSDEASATVSLPHDAALATHLPNPDIQTYLVPTAVLAHQTVASWALFKFPEQIQNDAIVEEYCIKLFDSHGLESTIQPIILQEIFDDE